MDYEFERADVDTYRLSVAYADSDSRYRAEHNFASAVGRKVAKELVGDTWFWQHLAVNFENGTTLFVGGSPLRASRIKVWAEDIRWKFATSVDAVITSPTGHGGSADAAWRFPGMPRFGIVIYQPNGWQQSITGDSFSGAQEFQVSNGHDLLVAVNDTRGNYLNDNSGAFSINVEVIQR